MEILGIGPSELIFVILIAIIILGPKDMQKAGRTIGRWLNQIIHSDGWKIFQKTSSEIRNLPRNLMREANMEMQETEKSMRKALDLSMKTPGITPNLNPPVGTGGNLPPSKEAENTIQPPTVKPSETDPDQHA